jgi:hypothetical protein
MHCVVRGLLLALVLGGVSALVVGCGDSGVKSVVVPLNQVPEPLVKIAKEKLPEVKFDHARRLPNGDYEIRGKAKNGKVREVELTPSGQVVEIE